MQSIIDNLTIELAKKYYEKGYWQGKHDEKDGVYIDKGRLVDAIEDDLTREMLNLSSFENVSD